MKLRAINLGLIKLHPLPRKYEEHEYIEFHEDLEKSDLRKASYHEIKYIFDLDQILSGFLTNNYSATLISEVTVEYDDSSGGYYDVVVDDPDEVVKFIKGEPAFGYTSIYGEQEVYKHDHANVLDWSYEKYKYFLVSEIN